MSQDHEMGVPASPSGHSDEPASSLAANAGSVPNAVIAASDCIPLFSVVLAPDGSFFAVRDENPRFAMNAADPMKAAKAAWHALTMLSDSPLRNWTQGAEQ